MGQEEQPGCQGKSWALWCPHLGKKWGTKRGREKMGAGEEEWGACGILLTAGWGTAPTERDGRATRSVADGTLGRQGHG